MNTVFFICVYPCSSVVNLPLTSNPRATSPSPSTVSTNSLPYAFDLDYILAPGIARFLAGTPLVLLLRPERTRILSDTLNFSPDLYICRASPNCSAKGMKYRIPG